MKSPIGKSKNKIMIKIKLKRKKKCPNETGKARGRTKKSASCQRRSER